jgi:hypothetical protein
MATTMRIGGVDVPSVKIVAPEDSTDMPKYVRQSRKTEVLAKGWRKAANKRPLSSNTIYDQNIEIKLRDGARVGSETSSKRG